VDRLDHHGHRDVHRLPLLAPSVCSGKVAGAVHITETKSLRTCPVVAPRCGTSYQRTYFSLHCLSSLLAWSITCAKNQHAASHHHPSSPQVEPAQSVDGVVPTPPADWEGWKYDWQDDRFNQWLSWIQFHVVRPPRAEAAFLYSVPPPLLLLSHNRHPFTVAPPSPPHVCIAC
jgi:hypothetical protein